MLTEIMKSEHRTLVASLREEINTEKQLVLRSIEKETNTLIQTVTTKTDNNKHNVDRQLEEHKKSLQSTYEKHANTIISSIELLKTSVIETINTQYERLQILDKFQLTVTEIIEQNIEKSIMKHVGTYRSTSIDVTTIQQLQSTIVGVFDNYFTTTRNSNDNELKQLLVERYEYLTDLLRKQQETVSLQLTTMKQSQDTVVATMEKFSTVSEYESLKQLIIDHRLYFTDIIEKQSKTLALALIKETVLAVIKEQTSISVIDRKTTIIPANVEQYQYLTDLLQKQQETISLLLTKMEQLQNTVVETMKKISTVKNESSQYESLKQLLIERNHYLIKETVLAVIKEQTSISVIDKNSTSISVIDKNSTPISVINSNSFKLSIQTAEFADIFAELSINGKKYDSGLYTLCQRDPSHSDVVNCFVNPPLKDGTLALTLYAKTKAESEYRAAISIQMSPQNIAQGITFPRIYPPFRDQKCILIEPLQRLIQINEQIFIHMILPGVRKVRIHNNDENIRLTENQLHNGIVQVNLLVRGNIIVYGQWSGGIELRVCAFEIDNTFH
jgi:hypothetical protein